MRELEEAQIFVTNKIYNLLDEDISSLSENEQEEYKGLIYEVLNYLDSYLDS